jgi:hypothetical protein
VTKLIDHVLRHSAGASISGQGRLNRQHEQHERGYGRLYASAATVSVKPMIKDASPALDGVQRDCRLAGVQVCSRQSTYLNSRITERY